MKDSIVPLNLGSVSKELSFFIPFKNEEKALRSTVDIISSVANNYLDKYEIILVDDGSTDSSGKIAQEVSKSPNVTWIQFPQSQGFGLAYLEGFRSARLSFAMYLSGDGDVSFSELAQILESWDGKKSVIQFARNSSDRLFFRFCLSKLYTFLVRSLSGTRFPYYNGFNIIPTRKKESLVLKDFGFCTQAYLLLEALKNEKDYVVISTESRFNDKTSQALTSKNIGAAFKFFFHLLRLS